MEGADEYESLMAQMDREYEEEERKRKEAKRGKKNKAAAGADEAGNSLKPVENVDTKKKEKKNAKKKEPKEPVSQNTGKDKEESKENEEKSSNIENEKKKSDTAEASTAAKKTKKKPEKPASDTKPAASVAAATAAEATPKVEDDAKKEPEEAAEASSKSSKKGGKDKPGAAKKKPGAGISALKEALAKAKEKEAELARQEEEKQKKEEELRQKKLEEERLEKERKLKKKQKEKERIERLKKEGKYETKEQKEAKQRALLQLQALGVRVPTKDTEETQTANDADKSGKKPKYERIRKKQQPAQTQKETDLEAKKKEEEEEKLNESVKESWEEVEEIKDEWDAESDSEEKKKSKSKKESDNESENEDNGSDDGEGEDDDDEEDSDEESDEEDEDSESEEDDEDKSLAPIERARLRIQKRHDEAEKKRSTDNLRAPVICVLGHVDTGKTKILDNLRRTKVQEDEAGGITQQIGATNVPLETVQERTKMCKHIYKGILKIPGLLIIDTPGHESFKSLRTRGSSLCDIAILVIDIMHGLEQQTIESINILKEKKTPFLVALNKIDRLYGWKSAPQNDVVKVLESQAPNTQAEFESRTNEVIVQLAELGLNAALYYKNTDPLNFISMVPTSAHTSDGIGNLMALITEFTQTILAKRVAFSEDLQCTVMEVKTIPGLGTTIDVCLVNGTLRVHDKIVIPGQEGPIVTQVRGLLMPQPNRDLRSKNNYVMHKEIKGAQGVKIAAKELEKAMAGLPLFVATKDDEEEYYREELQRMLRNALSSIRLSDSGVFVQASTLGSLEALLEFLRTSKIPYAGISIGPVHKKDVTMASIMLEKNPQYAVILAFDVRVEREAQDIADHVGVKIFTADIIYHLFDKFMGYRDELKKKKREEFKDVAVFPCKLKILPNFIFNTRDPIICGVKVEAGFIKVGSPLCALCEDASTEREGKDKFVDLGRISSIEYNHKPVELAKQGQEVCIKIDNTTGAAPKLLGRHFLATDYLVSKISRDSIDAVKNYFREEMTKSDWQLIIELKKQFQIM